MKYTLKTSPPTPLLSKERGDKAQLYRGEVKLYLTQSITAISVDLNIVWNVIENYLPDLEKTIEAMAGEFWNFR
ncbi:MULTISPECIES: ribonuclease HepT family protein [Nostocales]|uniref:hypothetical protein n=1 Tax=Nostocales TaxID=1161 RepID=UPI000496FA49|nr:MULTISPECIES: hypothetical protein [Nostocales]